MSVGRIGLPVDYRFFKQAAGALKINVPKEPMRTSKLMDGVVWDGKEPKKYADSFAIKASVA